jgi:hypothetical protein
MRASFNQEFVSLGKTVILHYNQEVMQSIPEGDSLQKTSRTIVVSGLADSRTQYSGTTLLSLQQLLAANNMTWSHTLLTHIIWPLVIS